MGAAKLADLAKNIEYLAKALDKGEGESGAGIESISKLMEDVTLILSKTKRAFDNMTA